MLIPLSSPSLKYAPESLSMDGDEDCGLSSKGSCRAREMCGEGPEPGPCSSLRLVGQTLTETHLPKPPMPPIALPSGPKTKPGATAASPRHEILRLLAAQLDENGNHDYRRLRKVFFLQKFFTFRKFCGGFVEKCEEGCCAPVTVQHDVPRWVRGR